MEARFGDNNNLPESCTPLVWLGAASAESGSIIVWVILRHYLHSLHEVGRGQASPCQGHARDPDDARGMRRLAIGRTC